MAHAMERLLATPKTMPNLPVSKDMDCVSLTSHSLGTGVSVGKIAGRGKGRKTDWI
jgi:hypothetical protein